jgi:hypothetical protein
MTLNEAFLGAYGAALANRDWILLGAVLVPVVGTLLARAGKAGRTDADGRFIASVVVGIGLLAMLVEVIAVFAAHSLMRASLMDADVRLVLAPLLCLSGCLVGIRWVFPLSELASVRTFIDVGAFVGACLGVLWLFSKFRGWGIVFMGSIAEMIAIGGLGLLLLKRLYKRAKSPGRREAGVP